MIGSRITQVLAHLATEAVYGLWDRYAERKHDAGRHAVQQQYVRYGEPNPDATTPEAIERAIRNIRRAMENGGRGQDE
jgi:hypothetical protein